jgi:hypothetical protein
MGDAGAVKDLLARRARLSAADRRALAAAVAPFEPLLAFSILPRCDHADRAACALAAGDLELAGRCLGEAGDAERARYLRGAVAGWRGDWRSARSALNDAFVADGMAPPLQTDLDEPTRMTSFLTPALPPIADGPLISVVVAAHNADRTLDLAIGSLSAQTWRNLEIIVVDDRSTDSTAAMAARLAERDPRVRPIANARGAGAYGARNTGIAAARGGFIALHDADDWAHPQRIERQMQALGPDNGITVCKYFRLDGAGRPMCPRVFPFVRLSPIAMTSRAGVWSETGPYDEVRVGADSEWLSRFDLLWGRRAGRRTREVGMVALWGDRSLSSAPSTGLSGEGLRARVAYVEHWRSRHASAKSRRTLMGESPAGFAPIDDKG